MSDEVSDLKTDIALIKKDVKQIERFFAKFDAALEAMSEVSQRVAVQGEILKNAISKIEELDERMDQHRIEDMKRSEIISDRLEQYRVSSKEDHQRLSDQSAKNRKERNEEIMAELSKMNGSLDVRLQNLDSRIQKLENWKWYMMGITAVIVFVATQVNWTAFFG